MADTLPPGNDRRAGKKGSGKSGKVADFRYKRSSQQGTRAKEKATGRPAQNGFAPRKPGVDTPAKPGQPARNQAPRQGEAYAALDLGTNNCRLLIARPSGRDFTVIDAFSRVVKLVEDLATTGRLSEGAMDRARGGLSMAAADSAMPASGPRRLRSTS